MLRPSTTPLLFAGLLLSAPAALAGPDWIEIGDAGSLPGTAQVPLRPPGAPQLSSISGTLSAAAGDFEDMYWINIVTPGTFSITVGSADFNSVLFLFNYTINEEAFGRLANDEQAPGNTLPVIVGAATDGTGVIISAPGDYLIGVAGRGRVPVSASGAIFDFGTLDEISGPDGPGGLNALSGWVGEGETGSYTITMIDIDFPRIPSPGAVALGGIALLAGARRRRS